MKSFFKEIFEYHHHCNQELIKQLLKNEADLSERSIYLISHLVNAHQIWNSRIINTASFGVHDLHSFLECSEIDKENFKGSIEIIENHSLDKVISYSNSSGDHFSNSIRDILFHVGNHFTHHRGQLISDLRQFGIAPIKTDYIFYKR